MPPAPMVSRAAAADLRFRAYRLLPGARLLLRGDVPVQLGSRAFDLLHILLASRGAVVAKSDLLGRVWPGVIVDESNLRFQVRALRTALGRDRNLIKTIPGRGYLLADEIPAGPQNGSASAAPVDGETARSFEDLVQRIYQELAARTAGARDEA
ncbi:MAG: winged helix-turn-helix domain-containing protein [Proteobacteria bacterium]|nr:winged helix-turn-helix domain-containing protein [Pseudomonadota bacterium]